MRGKNKGRGKGNESMIAGTEGRAELCKQARKRVTPPDSCEANPVYSKQRRDTKRK